MLSWTLQAQHQHILIQCVVVCSLNVGLQSVNKEEEEEEEETLVTLMNLNCYIGIKPRSVD